MSEETGKGPARVVEANIGEGRPLPYINMGSEAFTLGEDIHMIAEQINRALAPLTRKEALCERMVKFVHHQIGCDAEGDQECDCGLADLLKDWEAKK